MTVSRPGAAEIAEIATGLGYTSAAARAGEFVELVDGILGAFDAVAAAPLPAPERDAVAYRAGADPVNAWRLRAELRTTGSGPLAGRRVAVKDNILVAGLPMTAGARLLEGYVPSFDATAVARVLAAGATVVGKTNCEYLCLDGSSVTSDYGVVHNPHRHGYSAGGSSSGNAAALAVGDADLALGTDQAGSIRVPASFCGVVGLKPTHGLVPYTGVLGLDPVIDHLGPMATTVADTALLLGVLAGDDGEDPRQRAAVPDDHPHDPVRDLDRGVAGLRVGVLAEGFDHPGLEACVDAAVRAGAAALGGLGAEVVDVSVPGHAVGLAYWTPLITHGMAHSVVSGQGFGVGREERYPVELMERLFAVRERVAEMPSTVSGIAILAEWVRRHHGASFYARAIAAVRGLRAAYDAALADVDVLLMPTTPHVARPMPSPDAPVGEYVGHANDGFGNTAVFNATHHPALSVPCGDVDGLPVGMMLVGRRFDEATLLRVGHAFEAHAQR